MGLLDDIEAMAAAIREKRDHAFYDAVYGSPSLLRALPLGESPIASARQLFRMPVRESPIFPYHQSCSKCAGTGDGDTSTYCTGCRGAGRYRVDGMMIGANDSMAMIVHYFPPKPVRWPESVLVPKRATQAIRAVPWPMQDIRKS